MLSRSYTITTRVHAPTFSPAPGVQSQAVSVAISSMTSGTSFRYTTNGSTPTSTTGILYTNPIPISAATTIKAIAFKPGFVDSAVTTASYTFSANSYTAWVNSHPAYAGLTTAQRAPEAAPFGTGVKNLVVYALGLDPLNPVLPTAATTTVGSESRLTYTFTPAVVTGLNYRIEVSSDLSNWSTASDITALLNPGQPFTTTALPHSHHPRGPAQPPPNLSRSLAGPGLNRLR